jgi:uncharacterized membrane protein YfcA
MFIVIGVFSGLASGLFGIGGGVLVVPALAFMAGFSQEKAVGTSLAVLLPPVGLAAVLQYWRQGDVDLKGALWVAAGLFVGAWLGALLSLRAGEARMKVAFGIFLVVLGLWMVATASKGVPTHPRVM